MKTELTLLKKYINQYENASIMEDFEEAENYLCKVHDKYGTINVAAIRNLIK